MEYDYTGALFYSAKNYHKRKDGKLIYYVAKYCDSENLILKKIANPPTELSVNPKNYNDKHKWYVHNLDLLAQKYNISILQSEKK